METTIAILVLITVLAAGGALGYRSLQADPSRSWRDFLVAPASVRQTLGALGRRDADAEVLSPDAASVASAEAGEATAPRDERGAVTLAYDDTALATLERDLRRDLGATERTQREQGSRLERIEAALGEARRDMGEVGFRSRQRNVRLRQEVERLRYELETVRRGMTSAGQRRDEAYIELYGHLAAIEGAMGSALDPMFLPGEPLHLPDEFLPVTLEPDGWDEVGEHALAFGKAFNQYRLVLDPETATEIERFLAVLRRVMVGAVYPTVQRGAPTRGQVTQMRGGLGSVVEALGPVRRRLERTFGVPPTPAPEPDDEDNPHG